MSAADEKADKTLDDADSIGRSGLEASYDVPLRGHDGYQTVKLDPRGDAVGNGTTVPATAGDTLVTSIDGGVQALVEKSLKAQILASRRAGYAAPGGAVIVMDPATGRILAAASYPTYDPEVFVGGISVADYRKLTAPASDTPLLSRAIAGAYAPGSTFKLVSASSDVTNKLATLRGNYSCPSSLNVNGLIKHNFESEVVPGPVNLRLALQVSCDTWFYKFAVQEYYDDQKRIAKGEKPHEYLQHMATAFGFASSAQVDLPASEQTVGTFADRETRLARWKADRTQYCADARRGYPEIKNRTNRSYLTRLASENCTDGWRYRAGDNADMAIGQGETTVSPLQLAVGYSALVNGGTVYKPTLGWAEVNPAGKVVRTIKAQVKGKVPVSQKVLSYIKDSLHFVNGAPITAAAAFQGSPIKNELSGKTGTAEVYGKSTTSWMATWGPAPKAKFVVVSMIEQASTGAGAAGPLSRAIWNGLLGVGQPAVLAHSSPESTLPTVTPNAVPKALPALPTKHHPASTTPTRPVRPTYVPRTEPTGSPARSTARSTAGSPSSGRTTSIRLRTTSSTTAPPPTKPPSSTPPSSTSPSSTSPPTKPSSSAPPPNKPVAHTSARSTR